MMRTRRNQKFNFTFDGKPINGRILAAKIGISATQLYYIANKIKSENGNEITEYNRTSKRTPENTMEWNGVKGVLTAVVAKELGIKKPTLDKRRREYGDDCCLTYFPGQIPYRLLPRRKKPVQQKDKPKNQGTIRYQNTISKERNENLLKMKKQLKN